MTEDVGSTNSSYTISWVESNLALCVWVCSVGGHGCAVWVVWAWVCSVGSVGMGVQCGWAWVCSVGMGVQCGYGCACVCSVGMGVFACTCVYIFVCMYTHMHACSVSGHGCAPNGTYSDSSKITFLQA